MDEFEQLLSRQPLRRVPADWRDGIVPRRQSWFWPSPIAWAAVAACWLLIAGLQLASRPSPAPQMTAAPAGTAWAYRQQLITEFTGGKS